MRIRVARGDRHYMAMAGAGFLVMGLLLAWAGIYDPVRNMNPSVQPLIVVLGLVFAGTGVYALLYSILPPGPRERLAEVWKGGFALAIVVVGGVMLAGGARALLGAGSSQGIRIGLVLLLGGTLFGVVGTLLVLGLAGRLGRGDKPYDWRIMAGAGLAFAVMGFGVMAAAIHYTLQPGAHPDLLQLIIPGAIVGGLGVYILYRLRRPPAGARGPDAPPAGEPAAPAGEETPLDTRPDTYPVIACPSCLQFLDPRRRWARGERCPRCGAAVR